jgi:hypothetical protein
MRVILRAFRLLLGILSTGLVLAAAGCTSNSTSSTPATLSVSLGGPSVTVAQDGIPSTLALLVSGPSGTESVIVSGLPAGVTERFTSVNGGPSGTLTFTGGASVAAGSYSPTVSVTLAGQTQTKGFTLVSAVVAKVSTTPDTALGVNGILKQFMSTSFQISQYTGNFFGTGSTAATNEATLTELGPQHIRLQAIGGAIPMTADAGTASDWNFAPLDQIVQPVLASADRSPEFQIATAPAWMCLSNGDLDMANHLQDFANYAANLVRYYNAAGFTWGGQHFQSASGQHITWWGIFNEPNLNGLTPAQYVTLYDTVVPAMLAVDPTLKFSALEFSDYGLGTGEAGDPELYLPTFLAQTGSGGVNAQVNAISTHFYGGCDQLYTDAGLFAAVPQFVASVNYFYQELAARSDLAHVPVWVTENNVNADYPASNGYSSCNPAQLFVTDPRGTSAFFAAWRPYVFSQLGKAGNQALYQWQYTGDLQFGEVNASGNPYLSYWVDRALANAFPSTPSAPGPQILGVTATDTSSVETLAVLNANGTVTVMVVDLAVQSSTDNNGAGAPRTVVVDLSSFSPFYAASLLTIDAGTNAATGPTGVGVTTSYRMNVTLPGYGVAFLTLTP